MRSRFLGEFVATALLLMAISGSGMMATNLTSDTGLQLLINALSTIFALAVLISIFAPISGAHLNPVVSFMDYINEKIKLNDFALLVLAQIGGGIVGVIFANLMFSQPAISLSRHPRSGPQLLLGEFVATAGLIFIISQLTAQQNSSKAPLIIPAWIGSAYFFTSSTSFANPAVTVARGFTDTFSGIQFGSVAGFIAAQIIGSLFGFALAKVLNPAR